MVVMSNAEKTWMVYVYVVFNVRVAPENFTRLHEFSTSETPSKTHARNWYKLMYFRYWSCSKDLAYAIFPFSNSTPLRDTLLLQNNHSFFSVQRNRIASCSRSAIPTRCRSRKVSLEAAGHTGVGASVCTLERKAARNRFSSASTGCESRPAAGSNPPPSSNPLLLQPAATPTRCNSNPSRLEPSSRDSNPLGTPNPLGNSYPFGAVWDRFTTVASYLKKKASTAPTGSSDRSTGLRPLHRASTAPPGFDRSTGLRPLHRASKAPPSPDRSTEPQSLHRNSTAPPNLNRSPEVGPRRRLSPAPSPASDLRQSPRGPFGPDGAREPATESLTCTFSPSSHSLTFLFHALFPVRSHVRTDNTGSFLGRFSDVPPAGTEARRGGAVHVAKRRRKKIAGRPASSASPCVDGDALRWGRPVVEVAHHKPLAPRLRLMHPIGCNNHCFFKAFPKRGLSANRAITCCRGAVVPPCEGGRSIGVENTP